MVSPKGSTRYSKCPEGVTKAVRNIKFVDKYLVVGTPQIDKSKNLGASGSVHDRISCANWELVPYSVLVQRSVVNTESNFSILVGRKTGTAQGDALRCTTKRSRSSLTRIVLEKAFGAIQQGRQKGFVEVRRLSSIHELLGRAQVK